MTSKGWNLNLNLNSASWLSWPTSCRCWKLRQEKRRRSPKWGKRNTSTAARDCTSTIRSMLAFLQLRPPIYFMSVSDPIVKCMLACHHNTKGKNKLPISHCLSDKSWSFQNFMINLLGIKAELCQTQATASPPTTVHIGVVTLQTLKRWPGMQEVLRDALCHYAYHVQTSELLLARLASRLERRCYRLKSEDVTDLHWFC